MVRRVPGSPAFRDAEKERGVPLPSEQPEIEEAHAHSPCIADTDLVRTFGVRHPKHQDSRWSKQLHPADVDEADVRADQPVVP